MMILNLHEVDDIGKYTYDDSSLNDTHIEEVLKFRLSGCCFSKI